MGNSREAMGVSKKIGEIRKIRRKYGENCFWEKRRISSRRDRYFEKSGKFGYNWCKIREIGGGAKLENE